MISFFQLHLRQLGLSFFVGVHVLAEYDEPIDGELREHVDHHGAKEHDILVPSRERQRLAPPGGERRKHQIVNKDLRHRERHVLCGLEREFAVNRKVVDHRQRQRDQITRPIRPMDCLIQQRERRRLNDARRGGEQQILESLQKVLLLRELDGCRRLRCGFYAIVLLLLRWFALPFRLLYGFACTWHDATLVRRPFSADRNRMQSCSFRGFSRSRARRPPPCTGAQRYPYPADRAQFRR